MQYGWKPMMSDLFNSLEAVDRAQQANDLLYSVRKSSGWRKMVERIYDCQTSGNGLRFTLTEEELCTVKVYYQIQSSVLASLASVGLANPASIVWELVPYSFVIDWFLPVGNWFNTFDAALGKTFYGGYVSQGMKHPTTVGTHRLAPNVQTLGALSGYYEYECFNRTVLSSFPVPGFPGFKNPFSPGHVANGLALMANAFTRKYT